MAQVVKLLPTKLKALSSNTSTAKKKKKFHTNYLYTNAVQREYFLIYFIKEGAHEGKSHNVTFLSQLRKIIFIYLIS
jgi:hypothetical protein